MSVLILCPWLELLLHMSQLEQASRGKAEGQERS